ncbi:MAG TPA: hypothetical protein VKG80_07470 [Trebonia sp.]|nr:hypothetical protein [Trebonia sp.]
MSTTETPARLREQPGTPRHRRGARPVAIAAALAVTAALLWWGYYRLSWTVPATSDGAAIALQAHDMLHGNWLLSGWTVGDVSFWTTELPEYVLVETVRHLGPGVIHTAAALTYTLLVLLTGFLARGRARGREGLVRGLVAAGIMLAPQLGYGAFVLLLSPDHVGTEVPLLLGWLILDLAPRRWWVPVLLGLLLAWTQIGDRVSMLTAVVPLVVVCLVRAWRPRRERWFELALAAAGVASVAVAAVAEKLLIKAGWFTVYPLNLTLAPVRLLWTHIWLTGWGFLELFGANFIGVSGWPGVFFAIVHAAGLALAIAGFALALWRFLRLRADMDLVDSVLAVAIVCNLVSYVISTDPGTILGTGYDAREIAAVLPLGAVLAGRLIGPKLARREAPRSRSGYIALGLLACYGAALGYGAAQAAAPGDNADLAGWLAAHHLRYGLGRAESNIVTVDSGGNVHLAVVADRGGRVRPQLYQSAASWYDPRLHYANFIVASTPPGTPAYAPDLIAAGDARRTFGPPARTYRFGGYTVMVWDVNLLTRLR